MDLVKAVQDYVTRMIEDNAGMKVLLLDAETTAIVSLVFSQTHILSREVFLVERLDMPNRERMSHLRALVFVRPTDRNIQLLKEEFKNPKHKDYFIYFSNMASQRMVEELAESDEHETVRQVQEFFGDYLAVSRDVFSFNLFSTRSLYASRWESQQHEILRRAVDGLSSVFLAMKKRPVIRYTKGSDLTQVFAQEMCVRMDQNQDLFNFRMAEGPPLLLILDRRNDPVTPLLTQWTYQAMVHELLGMNNNRVSLKHVPGVKKEMEEVVLSCDSDEFYAKNIFQNFGDLGQAVKSLVDNYQSKHSTNKSIQSIEDMQRFVEEYPEFRKMSGNVSKHVGLMSELSRQIEVRKLMDVSGVEQEMACHENHQAHVQEVTRLLQDRQVSNQDALRLVMIYALRYERESSSQLPHLMDLLNMRGVPAPDIGLITSLYQYAGAKMRTGDLFGNKNILNVVKKSVQRGLKGVSNIYTQHKPLMSETLTLLLKGKLKDTQFPYATEMIAERPQEVVVFFVGGVTFEEERAAAQLQNEFPGVRITVGGTAIHNSRSFIGSLIQ